jgi:hypothetical protein
MGQTMEPEQDSLSLTIPKPVYLGSTWTIADFFNIVIKSNRLCRFRDLLCRWYSTRSKVERFPEDLSKRIVALLMCCRS